MRQETFDRWEEKFLVLCERVLEEEPLYGYSHLWKKEFSPEEAFREYLKENPDYDELVQEKLDLPVFRGDGPDADYGSDSGSDFDSDPGPSREEVLRLRKEQEDQKRIEEAERKLSRFCPDCARIMKKNICKCGFRRKTKAPGGITR